MSAKAGLTVATGPSGSPISSWIAASCSSVATRNTITWLPTKMIAPSRSFIVESTASPSTTVPLVLERSVISNVPSSGAGAIARCWPDTIRSGSTSDVCPVSGLRRLASPDDQRSGKGGDPLPKRWNPTAAVAHDQQQRNVRRTVLRLVPRDPGHALVRRDHDFLRTAERKSPCVYGFVTETGNPGSSGLKPLNSGVSPMVRWLLPRFPAGVPDAARRFRNRNHETTEGTPCSRGLRSRLCLLLRLLSSGSSVAKANRRPKRSRSRRRRRKGFCCLPAAVLSEAQSASSREEDGGSTRSPPSRPAPRGRTATAHRRPCGQQLELIADGARSSVTCTRRRFAARSRCRVPPRRSAPADPSNLQIAVGGRPDRRTLPVRAAQSATPFRRDRKRHQLRGGAICVT